MSILLAKILGLYFVGIGLAFLINQERLKNIYKQISRDEPFLLIGGILALLIGSVIVTLHNYWIMGWPVIVTIIGWWSLIKGFSILAFPGFIKFFSFLQNKSKLFYTCLILVYVVLGLFLLYKGWQG